MEKWVGIQERGQGYLLTLKARDHAEAPAVIAKEMLVVPATNETDTEIALGRAIRELLSYRVRDRRKKRPLEAVEQTGPE